MEKDTGVSYPVNLLYNVDSATGNGDRVSVSYARLVERCKRIRDMVSMTPTPAKDEDIDIGLSDVATESMQQFVRMLTSDEWPRVADAESLFTRNTRYTTRLMHWNAAAIAHYLECPAITGFYIWAFNFAHYHYERNWFVFTIDEGTKVPTTKMTTRSMVRKNKGNNSALRSDPGTLSTTCEKCGAMAQGVCGSCHAVLACSLACLQLVHGQCFAMLFAPGSGEINLLDHAETQLRYLIEDPYSYTLLQFNDTKYATRSVESFGRYSPWTERTKTTESDFEAVATLLLHGGGKSELLHAYFYQSIVCGYVGTFEAYIASKRVKLDAEMNLPICLVAKYGSTEMARTLLSKPEVDPSADNNFAIRIASVRGVTELVDLLLHHPKVDPSAKDNEALIQALDGKHRDVIALLIQDARVDPSVYDNRAIRWASGSGWDAIVKMLLRDTRVDPTVAENQSILYASQEGHIRVVRTLLLDPRIKKNKEILYDAACIAAAYGHANIVELLLEDKDLDLTANDGLLLANVARAGWRVLVDKLLNDPRIKTHVATKNQGLLGAAASENIDILELFLRDPDVDPSIENNAAITKAIRAGKIENVKRLVSDRRIKISDNEKNDALLVAILHGHADIVRFLLLLDGTDPRANHGYVLEVACQIGYANIVKILLDDGRVDPSFAHAARLGEAVSGGHAAVVKLFLDDPRIKPNDANGAIVMLLETASIKGYADVVALLLSHPKIDPTLPKNKALTFAIKHGKTDVVKLLLDDGRFDPAANGNRLIELAADKGHADILALLLQYPNVDPTVSESAPLRVAVKNGHVPVVETLLRDGRADPAANGNEAIIMAAALDDPAILELLLKDGRADPAVKHDKPIRMAARNGHDKCVELLLADKRVDPTAKDNQAARMASRYHHYRVIHLLHKDGRARVPRGKSD